MKTRLGYSRLLKAIEATNGNMGGHAVSVVNTETKKAGFFTNKKVQVVAGTTDKLFCEGKRPDFFVESRDSTGDFGLKAHWSVRQLQRQIETLL